MRIVYTDENRRLRDLAELMGPQGFEFRRFVNDNIALISKYDYGMVRVQPSLCKERFNIFFKKHGFQIGDKSEHAHGIGNNNMNYVQDLKSGEYIGALHLNKDPYGPVYCYATDIHKNRVSPTYKITRNGISLEKHVHVDWTEYQFGREDHALNVIEDAVKAKVLAEGTCGGVMVYKLFDNGTEGWQEVSKEEAAKDLLEQGEVDTLLDAIGSRSKQSLDAQIQSSASRAAAKSVEHQGKNKISEPSR